MRNILIELIEDTLKDWECDVSDKTISEIAEHLLANGVIVPPCKVGDKVYKLDKTVWHSECCHCEHYRIGGFGDPSECGRTEDGFKHPECTEIIEEAITQHGVLYYLSIGAFGITVFLTREEAEQALKGGEG